MKKILNPTVLLRVAAIVTLLYCIGHSMGWPWTPATGPEEQKIIDAMKTHHFDVDGIARTFEDFYLGFGIIISAFMLFQAVVLWQVGSLANSNPKSAKAIAFTFLLSFVVNAFLAWKYFFPVPAIMAVVIAASLAGAMMVSPRDKKQ